MTDTLDRLEGRTAAEIAVSLSLDGLEHTHEEIRGAKGNWNQVWDTFEMLRARGGVKLKINTVLHKDNSDEIISLMQEVRRRGPDFHSIILLRGDPMNPESACHRCQPCSSWRRRFSRSLESYDYGMGGCRRICCGTIIAISGTCRCKPCNVVPK